MKRFTCLFALAIGAVVTGCSSAGDDVYVEPRTGQSQASLSCVIEPGEDVCDRSFDMIDATTRPTFVSFAATASQLAGLAREGRRQVASACEAIVDALGATRPVLAPEATDKARAITTCDVAIAAIATVDRTAFTISLASSNTCLDVPPAACALSTASVGKDCLLPPTYWIANDGATARDQFVADTLSKNLGVAFAAKGRLEVATALTRDVTGNTNRLADVTGPGARACVQTVTSLVGAASDDLGTMAELSAKLVTAIDPSM